MIQDTQFTSLGKSGSEPSKTLDTFPAPEGISVVRFTSEELCSFCPVTRQPDLSTLVLDFIPDKKCVESKSLKLYLQTFRDEGIFGEALACQIAGDIWDQVEPVYVRVEIIQGIRGGLQMTATSEIGSRPR